MFALYNNLILAPVPGNGKITKVCRNVIPIIKNNLQKRALPLNCRSIFIS